MRWLPVIAIGVARVRACGEGGADVDLAGSVAGAAEPICAAAQLPASHGGRLGLLVTTSRDGCGVVVVGVGVGTGSEGVVRPGDRVVAVDGEAVAGFGHATLEDFVDLAAGTPGSVARLAVTDPEDPCGTGELREVPRTVFADGVPLIHDDGRVRASKHGR